MLDYTSDKFNKDKGNIISIQMLNSEGYITGDNTGKIRAWIIGFNTVPTQPEQLDIIEELTEHSEKSNMHSHRSYQSLNNFQTNSSSSQVDHQGSTTHQRPSITLSQDNNFPQPPSSQQNQGSDFPAKQTEEDFEHTQKQYSSKDQMLQNVKASFQKKSKDFIEAQSIPYSSNNNKNAQILIQETLEQNYPDSDRDDDDDDDNEELEEDEQSRRENRSETLIRNNKGNSSPPVVIHSDETKRSKSKINDSAKLDSNQTSNSGQNQQSKSAQKRFQNDSENNLDSKQIQEAMEEDRLQQNTQSNNFAQSPRDIVSIDNSAFSSSASHPHQSLKQQQQQQQKNDQLRIPTENNSNNSGLNQNINSNQQDFASSSSSHKRINLNLPLNLLKTDLTNNALGQKQIVQPQAFSSDQNNDLHEMESDGESLPIQQTLNLQPPSKNTNFNTNNTNNNNPNSNPEQPPNLVRQSNSQISSKSEDKNIFTQTVSRLINPESQMISNNSDIPAHRRIMSNTTHQSEDTSFDNMNAIPSQFGGATGPALNATGAFATDLKGKSPIKQERKEQSDPKNDFGNFPQLQMINPYSKQRLGDDDSLKQMIGSGKYNSFKINNLPSILSHQEDDQTEESIVISSSLQDSKSKTKPIANFQIKEFKEPEHNSEQLTKLLNSQDNKIKPPTMQQVVSFYETDSRVYNKQSSLQHQQQIQDLTNHNTLLQKKIDELLSLNGRLSSDKEKQEKEIQSLKHENEELQKKSPRIEKEKINKMYGELVQKMNTLEKLKEDIVKSNPNSQQQQQQLLKKYNTLQEQNNTFLKQNNILQEQNNTLQEENAELKQKALLLKECKTSYTNDHNFQQEKISLLTQEIQKLKNEGQIQKEKIQILTEDVKRLTQQEVSRTQNIVQLEQEKMQLSMNQKEKDKVIENLTRQLKQKDQIHNRSIPAINTATPDYKPTVLNENNSNTHSTSNSKKDHVMIDKILEVNTENGQLKKRIKVLEQQLEQYEKIVSEQSLQKNGKSSLYLDSTKKNQLISNQQQPNISNVLKNTNIEIGSHRKAVSYLDGNTQQDKNKTYGVTIHINGGDQTPTKTIQPTKETYNLQIQKQSQPQNQTKIDVLKPVGSTSNGQLNNTHRNNQSLDLAALQRNYFNAISSPMVSNKGSVMPNDNKQYPTQMQKLQEITNKQMYYTPSKTTNTAASQNNTTNSSSYLNTSQQNNNSLTPRTLRQMIDVQKVVPPQQQQAMSIQKQQNQNIQTTPTQQHYLINPQRTPYQRTNLTTLNSDTANSQSFDQMVQEIQNSSSALNIPRFLQQPTPSQQNQLLKQQQLNSLNLSASPQKTVNPYIPTSTHMLNNPNSQNAAFFNGVPENNKTSNPTTPQRTVYVQQTINNQQIPQQQPYLPNQQIILQNQRMINTSNTPSQLISHNSQKRPPIFDQSPVGRHQIPQGGTIRVPISDEKLHLQNSNNIAYSGIDTSKFSGNNSFRASDNDFDYKNQGSPFHYGNSQVPLSRRFDDNNLNKKKKSQIFNNTINNLTPSRQSLNTSLQQHTNLNILNHHNNKLNASYNTQLPQYDGVQYSNR